MYGHPVALLVYHDFERFEAAKRKLRFDDKFVQYGDEGPSTLPDNYGAARYVRLGGASPTDEDEFSPVQNAVIWGAFKDDEVVWPPADPDDENPFIPASVKGKHRGGGGERDPEVVALETADGMRAGMDIAAELAREIDAARENPDKIVLNRRGSTQAIEPSADRKSTRLNSSHVATSYAVIRLK